MVIGSLFETLVWFRGPLLQELVQRGHSVTACAAPPSFPSPMLGQLEAMGVTFQPVFLQRTGLNPFADARTICSLAVLFRRLRPDLVLAYAIKPVIYGSFAARLAGVPEIHSLIEGLGYSFAGADSRWLSAVVKALYRAALVHSRRVFFLNPDDKRLFEELGIVGRPERTVLLNGVGVDLDWYAPLPLPEPISFLLVARLLVDKGLREYVEAARIVKARHPDVQFRLVGWIDTNPTAVRQDELQAWVDEGVIDFLGRLDDVRPALAGASVFVLPSYYPEGQPRSIMEAMASGRPIITTDVPGCRETVIHGRNGYLVPARDGRTLAQAMLRFIEQPQLIDSMGRESRRLAETRYDVHQINRRILDELGLA